jgi:eukaryotic-like serine/threonine-protein kinase
VIGAKLGSYEITAKLGEGGMGEVYRATDSRLRREVAIKVLPQAFLQDPERLARFEREAQVLAQLQHPNIAAIYGIEESASSRALIMELVEGETLAERISRGSLSPDEALPIARQIAEALEAAHERGIVHRDLKPQNVKLRPDGTVKVLDFGLAKALEPVRGSGDPSRSPTLMNSPTMTAAGTQLGVILGTAAYMAPEQARGKTIDKRADIWAFGAVLFEMLAGARAFPGDEVSDVLASVLAREPNLTAVPPRVRRLLTRCLEKDPRKRLRDIGDAMGLVDGPGVAAPNAETAATMLKRMRLFTAGGWTAAAALAVSLVAALGWRPGSLSESDPPIAKFRIERASDVYNRTASAFAVSPDGLMLAYYDAGSDGLPTLFVRILATGDVREVPGSATAAPRPNSLFWSPDSRQLVRGAATGGQVFDLSTGTSRPLCDCSYVGGSWNRDGTILLGGFDSRAGISRVSANDRTPVAVTTVAASADERDTWPVFLPDGRRFLFTRTTAAAGVATYVGSLDGDPPKRVVDGSRSIFVPVAGGRGSYLLGVESAGLVAQPFNLSTMTVTGPVVTVAVGATSASASGNGVLATNVDGGRPKTVPTWFDRKGTSLGQVGEAGFIDAVALSRDGRKLAVSRVPDANPAGSDIWLYDLVGGSRTRLTFSRGSTPVWSPDGTRIAFTSRRNGVNLLSQRAADGTGGEIPLFDYDRNAWVNDWSGDGRWVIYSTPSTDKGAGGNGLWAFPMAGGTERKSVPYLVASPMQQQAQFSPDGRFIAYGSDQSGTWEIYVQPFPNAAEGKWMVSSGGGTEPRWSADGKELFYFSGQTLMAVPVSVRPTFTNSVPQALFDAPILAGYTSDSHRWQVASDGRRFLLLANDGKNQGPPLDVIVNWPALLQK